VVFYGFETLKQKIMSTEKDLNYWKANAEEDYMQVPISVLRYIAELETAVKNCSIPDVSNCDAIFEQDAKLTQEEIEEDCRNIPN
jgi:hypothetical protein